MAIRQRRRLLIICPAAHAEREAVWMSLRTHVRYCLFDSDTELESNATIFTAHAEREAVRGWLSVPDHDDSSEQQDHARACHCENVASPVVPSHHRSVARRLCFAVDEEATLHPEFHQRNVTNVKRSHWNLLFSRCQSVFRMLITMCFWLASIVLHDVLSSGTDTFFSKSLRTHDVDFTSSTMCSR